MCSTYLRCGRATRCSAANTTDYSYRHRCKSICIINHLYESESFLYRKWIKLCLSQAWQLCSLRSITMRSFLQSPYLNSEILILFKHLPGMYGDDSATKSALGPARLAIALPLTAAGPLHHHGFEIRVSILTLNFKRLSVCAAISCRARPTKQNAPCCHQSTIFAGEPSSFPICSSTPALALAR